MVNREDLTEQENKILTTVQDYLVILGGTLGDNVTKKEEVFTYFFLMSHKQGPLEWFVGRSSMNMSYKELKENNIFKADMLC